MLRCTLAAAALALLPILPAAAQPPAAPGHSPPAAAEPATAGPHAVPGWYLGMPVLLRAGPPPAGIDRRTLPSFPVYITAPVSETAGFAPMKTVERPDGSRVALPPHQDTLAAMNSAGAPRLGIGYFVQRGPKGTTETVRVQPQPEHSWPSAPLAYEMRIGPEWVKLNNHVIIEHGVKTGLLQLEFFDVGGMMWGEFLDREAAKLAASSCTLESPPPLPSVDWEADQDFQPGQQR